MRSVSPVSQYQESLTISSSQSEEMNQSALISSFNKSALLNSNLKSPAQQQKILQLSLDMKNFLSPHKQVQQIVSDNIPRLRLIFSMWQKIFSYKQMLFRKIKPIFINWQDKSFSIQVNRIQLVLNLKIQYRTFQAIKYQFNINQAKNTLFSRTKLQLTTKSFQSLINYYNRVQIIIYDSNLRCQKKIFQLLKIKFTQSHNLLTKIENHEISHYFSNWRNFIKAVKFDQNQQLKTALKSILALAAVYLVSHDQNYARIKMSQRFREIGAKIFDQKIKPETHEKHLSEEVYLLKTDINQDLGAYKKFVQKVEFQDSNRQDIERLRQQMVSGGDLEQQDQVIRDVQSCNLEFQQGDNNVFLGDKKQQDFNNCQEKDLQEQNSKQCLIQNEIIDKDNQNDITLSQIQVDDQTLCSTEQIDQLEQFLNEVEDYQENDSVLKEVQQSVLVDQLNLYKNKLESLEQNNSERNKSMKIQKESKLEQDLILSHQNVVKDNIYTQKDKLANYMSQQKSQKSLSMSNKIQQLQQSYSNFALKTEFPDKILFKRYEKQQEDYVEESKPSSKKQFTPILTKQQCIIKSLIFIIDRNLLQNAINSWHIITLRKVSYNIKNKLSQRFFRFKITDKYFQQIKQVYYDKLHNHYTICKAQNTIKFIQKQFFFRILQFKTVQQKLMRIKLLYIQSICNKKLKEICYFEIISKFRRLTNNTFRLKVIQNKVKKYTIRAIFNQFVTKLTQLQSYDDKALVHYQQAFNFKIYLIFHNWKTQRLAINIATTSYNEILTNFFEKNVPTPQNIITNQISYKYDFIAPINVKILTPGGWFDSMVPNYRILFKNWRKCAKISSIYAEIEARIKRSQQKKIKLKLFKIMSISTKEKRVVSNQIYQLKSIIFNVWRVKNSHSLQLFDISRQILLEKKRKIFIKWQKLSEKVQFLASCEMEISSGVEFRLRISAFSALRSEVKRREMCDKLLKMIGQRVDFYLKYKFLFAMFSLKKDLRKQALEQRKLLKNANYEFSKILVFKKNDNSYTFPELFFDFRITYLINVKRVNSSLDFQVERLRKQLYAKIVDNDLRKQSFEPQQECPDLLSLSKLDLKMDEIQQRLENIK